MLAMVGWSARFAFLLSLFLLPSLSRAETRVALVIGESAYRNVAQLPNPVRDAQAVAASLRKVGFSTVQVSTDLDKAGLEAALQGFAATARNADVALIYYAGHGVEVGGNNYLVPVNARLAADSDVQFEAISLDLVLSAVAGARQLKMVVLDACRDNPFLVTMRRTSGSRSVGRGLARVEPDAGTLVAYAAREGSTAADGDRGHSPFSKAFIDNIGQPGLEIRLLFGRIHDDVLEATGQKQEPATYASLGGKPFYFVPGNGAADVRPAADDSKSVELAFWSSIGNATDPDLYEAYLRSYPQGAFASLARHRIASLRTAKEPAPAKRGVDGAWSGFYRYDDGSQRPVQFALLLTSSAGNLSGSITEPNSFGDPKVPFLRATVQGRIDGQSVRFTKHYDGTGGQSHSVDYQGQLDPAATTMRGRWAIGGISGAFELHLKEP